MISIVIPVFNAAQYLPNMLDSVINQSYKNIEIILVNDGSTDNSSQVCHKYANLHNYITVYDRQNHGASASRNFGATKAKGDFIWFMDSDDILENNALFYAIELQAKYNADIVIGGMNFCFSESNRVVQKVISKEMVLNEQMFKQQYHMLFSINYISSLCNKLIRRSLIFDNNVKLNESLSMYEDFVFCMDILFKCKTVVCHPKIFYNYQFRNTNSLSHRYKNHGLQMFFILENNISRYINYFDTNNDKSIFSLNNLLIYFAYECIKNEARHRKSYLKVRNILHNETFYKTILKYNGYKKKYKIIHYMIRRKMAFFLIVYFIICRKI